MDKLSGFENARLLQRALLLEYVTLAWMSVEALASVATGLLAGSFALIAFGADSFIELISAYTVTDHLRKNESETLDTESTTHHDERATLVTSILLFILIPTIAVGAAATYLSGVRPEASPPGIAVAVAAAIVMPYLWIEKRRIGREAKCVPLSLDAVESATCFFMSLALLGGLLVEYFLGIFWVDYVATAIILAFIAREAFESFRIPRL